MTQVGAGEVGAGEVGLLQVDVPQIGAPQVGVFERGQPHVGSRKDQPLEPGAVQLDAGERDLVAHEILEGIDPAAAAPLPLGGVHHLPRLIVRRFAGDLGRFLLGLPPLAPAEPELPGTPQENQRLRDLDDVGDDGNVVCETGIHVRSTDGSGRVEPEADPSQPRHAGSLSQPSSSPRIITWSVWMSFPS
jgi:hypothetical protein